MMAPAALIQVQLGIKAGYTKVVWAVECSPSSQYLLDYHPHEDMQFTTSSVFFVLLAMLSTAWSTLALPVLQSREVFDPPITFPKAGDVFSAGQTIKVTWFVCIGTHDEE